MVTGDDDILEQVKLSQEAFKDSHMLQFVDSFGVFHLTVTEAARLTVLDMWFEGNFPDVTEPEDFNGDSDDPLLNQLLAKYFSKFRGYIRESIQNKEIEPSHIQKDFDGNISDKDTYISFESLSQWLMSRGYEYGEILSAYCDVEVEVQSRVCDYIQYLRAYTKCKFSFGANAGIGPLVFSKATEATSREDFQSMLMNAIAVNKSLKEKISKLEASTQTNSEKPLTTRNRRTLLTLLLALCEHGKISISTRGTSQRLKEMTERTGYPVSDDTIQKVLAEINELIDLRRK